MRTLWFGLRMAARMYGDMARKLKPTPRRALVQINALVAVAAAALIVVTLVKGLPVTSIIGQVFLLTWSLVWPTVLVRTGDVPIRDYFRGNAFRQMLREFDTPPKPEPDPEPEPCEGASAFWCPHCGDCTCANPEDSLDDADCPLHGAGSDHAEPNSPGNYARARWRYPNINPVSNPGHRGCLRWHIYMHGSEGWYMHADDDTPCDISNGPS